MLASAYRSYGTLNNIGFSAKSLLKVSQPGCRVRLFAVASDVDASNAVRDAQAYGANKIQVRFMDFASVTFFGADYAE